MPSEVTSAKSRAPKTLSTMKWLRYVQEMGIPIGDPFSDYKIALHRDPIHKTQIPSYYRLLRQGTDIAKPAVEGTAQKIKHRRANETDTIVVKEGHFGFGSPEHLQNSRFLVTYDVITCLALVAYNPESKAGLLAHAFEPVNVADAVSKAVDFLDAKTIVLFGGRSNESESVQNVCLAEALLARHKDKIKVVGRYTLKQERPTAIGIDTKDGSLFFPKNGLRFTGIGSYPLRAWLPFAKKERWNGVGTMLVRQMNVFKPRPSLD